MKPTTVNFVSLALFGCLLIASNSNAHKYKSGECPSVEPMTDFNMKQVRLNVDLIVVLSKAYFLYHSFVSTEKGLSLTFSPAEG